MEKRIDLERRARKANQITDLNLDNCRSTSIVGLTDEYTALESLSLINVGLTTLKGFPKLPNLKKLELSDNRISNGLHYLNTSPKLQYLNLSGNKIKDLEALKPLAEFKQLAILDLFNNEATQIENYREKIFEMVPSLQFLDGFDCNDVEAPSEGDDEEENGNYSEDDDKQNAFNVNGLEIDLDELEAFEKRVKAKREAALKQQEQITKDCKTTTKQTTKTTETNSVETEDIDDLDEYLKTLQLKEVETRQKQQQEQETQQLSSSVTTIVDPSSSNSQNSPLNFAILLYWFLAILNLASATFYSEGESGDDEDGEGGTDGSVSTNDVSLSEVYNDDLEEDEGEWDEENAENEEDDDEDSDEDDEANDSAVNTDKAAEDNTAAADESQSRGKKRKHEG
ncbi:acidic leucine-rich nuclear phosphoprotein 32 mapmodulin isoform X1 [Haematobia irritans]|uniref:acidic leucine-rich nuclear phosphoprotein 32 mapmodulin isoform X1 n=1 Tax=Haematobia irritans TaxID=7368 RepID=UPI003F4F4C51